LQADAQLAYLNRCNYIISIITEDSDLLVFGCKRVLFKMDHQGNGEELRMKNLSSCTELNFTNWTHEMFQTLCILSGCDYLNSVAGIGIKRAHLFVNQLHSYDKVIRRLKFEGKVTVPKNYEREFEMALLTFQHQRVFDREARKLVHLNPLPEGFHLKYGAAEFLGPAFDDEIACRVADGLIHPETKQAFAPVQPQLTTSNSIVNMTPRSVSLGFSTDAAASQSNTLNTYFMPATKASQRAFIQPRKAQDTINGRAVATLSAANNSSQLDFLNEFQYNSNNSGQDGKNSMNNDLNSAIPCRKRLTRTNVTDTRSSEESRRILSPAVVEREDIAPSTTVFAFAPKLSASKFFSGNKNDSNSTNNHIGNSLVTIIHTSSPSPIDCTKENIPDFSNILNDLLNDPLYCDNAKRKPVDIEKTSAKRFALQNMSNTANEQTTHNNFHLDRFRYSSSSTPLTILPLHRLSTPQPKRIDHSIDIDCSSPSSGAVSAASKNNNEKAINFLEQFRFNPNNNLNGSQSTSSSLIFASKHIVEIDCTQEEENLNANNPNNISMDEIESIESDSDYDHLHPSTSAGSRNASSYLTIEQQFAD
jgi:hypothetical protein